MLSFFEQKSQLTAAAWTVMGHQETNNFTQLSII